MFVTSDKKYFQNNLQVFNTTNCELNLISQDSNGCGNQLMHVMFITKSTNINIRLIFQTA